MHVSVEAPSVFEPALAVRIALLLESNRTDQNIIEELNAGGHQVLVVAGPSLLRPEQRAVLSTAEIILVDLASCGPHFLEQLESLNSAIGICDVQPRLLCFSMQHRNPRFVLKVQRRGARYVRVSSPAMLLEAINLLVVEMNDLRRNGPSFHIIHRYSPGNCTPGEEISAVFLISGSESFQLPLALAQRFVFDFLAQHRRIALDSLQIVSGLSGDRFYREHAFNSGHRQIKKIRRPAVKVLIQRIRDAMALAFARAHVKLDPSDVLRSCRAEGSRRVLYKLCAQIEWRHGSQ